MQQSWSYIFKPAKVAVLVDSFVFLLIGLPAIFIGNPLESIDWLVTLNVEAIIVFGLVIVCGIVSTTGLTMTFFRLLTRFAWNKIVIFISSTVFLIVLGYLAFILSFLTLVSVAWNGF